MKTLYVEIDPKYTRLGNWLFQYAAAKSANHGGPVKFVIDNPKSRAVFERYRELFPDPIIDVCPPGEELRTDFYQHIKYLDENIVRQLYKVSGERDERVSIHVRRGDYMWLLYAFPFVGEDYLRKAVESFGPDRKFLVFSDDIPWCKRFFRGERFAFSEGHSALEDLYAMARCRDHICSNSSFSWWGAYLGPGGRTIFPSMWCGFADDDRDASGMYFPGSEIIENNYSPSLLRRAKWQYYRMKCRHFFKSLRFWKKFKRS